MENEGQGASPQPAPSKYQWVQYVAIPLMMLLITYFGDSINQVIKGTHNVTAEEMKVEIRGYFDQRLKEVTDSIKQKVDMGYELFGTNIEAINIALADYQKKEGAKAVTLRVDSTGKLLYHTTKGMMFPAYYREKCRCFTYINTNKGTEHVIFLEERVPIEEFMSFYDIINRIAPTGQ